MPTQHEGSKVTAARFLSVESQVFAQTGDLILRESSNRLREKLSEISPKSIETWPGSGSLEEKSLEAFAVEMKQHLHIAEKTWI